MSVLRKETFLCIPYRYSILWTTIFVNIGTGTRIMSTISWNLKIFIYFLNEISSTEGTVFKLKNQIQNNTGIYRYRIFFKDRVPLDGYGLVCSVPSWNFWRSHYNLKSNTVIYCRIKFYLFLACPGPVSSSLRAKLVWLFAGQSQESGSNRSNA
jgi:hypothetical protein